MAKTKEAEQPVKVYARIPRQLQQQARLEAIRRDTTLDKLIGQGLALLLRNAPKVSSS